MCNNPRIDTQLYHDCVNSWRNLHSGLFYSQIPRLISNTSLKKLIENFEYPIMSEGYKLDKQNLEVSLRGEKNLVNGFNNFSFWVLWNYYSNIFRTIREGLTKEYEFKNYIKEILDSDYNDFEEVIYFLRNFFSHNIDEEFRIHSDDIRNKKYNNLNIDIILDSKRLKLNGTLIKVQLHLDFSKINSGDKLTNNIKLDKIFLLTDFCSRLTLKYQDKLVDDHFKKFQ